MPVRLSPCRCLDVVIAHQQVDVYDARVADGCRPPLLALSSRRPCCQCNRADAMRRSRWGQGGVGVVCSPGVVMPTVPASIAPPNVRSPSEALSMCAPGRVGGWVQCGRVVSCRVVTVSCRVVSCRVVVVRSHMRAAAVPHNQCVVGDRISPAVVTTTVGNRVTRGAHRGAAPMHSASGSSNCDSSRSSWSTPASAALWSGAVNKAVPAG